MDTRLYISKELYKNQTVTREIDFTQSPYVLTPNGQHTDVTVGDWHYGAVNYDNTSPLYGWQPEASQIGDTQVQTTYWDLGINEPTALEVRLEITNSAPEDGVIEIGFGNEFRQVTNSGTVSLSFSPTAPDPYGVYGYKLVFRASGGTYIPSVPTTLYIHSIKVKYTANIYDPQYKEVDLYDDIDIPITYNVGDVRDISKKDANWSLTIRMPNTQNNAQLFELNNDISRYNSTFEMLKQYPAFVEVGCNRTFAGYFKLTKVIINDDKEVSYEGNLYSNVIEFMSRLGTTTLRGNSDPADDLSFSEYKRPLVEQDWLDLSDMLTWDTATPPNPTGEKPYGRGWYITAVDKFVLDNRTMFLPEEIPMFFDEYTPFLFYKEIWDKLFKWAGFNYVSGFIDGTSNPTTFKFDHLVYPRLNNDNRDIYDEGYAVIQERNSVYTDIIAGNNWTPDPYIRTNTQIFSDNSNNLITEVNGQGTVGLFPVQVNFASGGIFHLKSHIPFAWRWWLTKDEDTSVFYNETTTVDCSQIGDYMLSVKLVQHTSNLGDIILTEYRVQQGYEPQYNFDNGICKPLDENGSDVKYLDYDGNIYVGAGDYLYLQYEYYIREFSGFSSTQWVAVNPSIPPLDHTGRMVKGVMYILTLPIGEDLIRCTKIDGFYPDSEFDPTTILDANEKKVDFFTNIIRKFNLYIEDVTDKKDENGVYYRDYVGIRPDEPILRIEPRNAYYSRDMIVRDWTNKTDVSTIEFERIDDYIYKFIEFSDTNDKTYYTDDYEKNSFIEGDFGTQKIRGEFCTSDEDKCEIKTKLGETMNINPTPYYTNPNTLVTERQKPNLYLECPSVFKLNDYGSYKDNIQWNTRMLFLSTVYNGADPNDVYPWDFQDIYNASKIKSWAIHYRNEQFPGEFVNGTFWKKYSTYNLLSHLNAPFGNDDADLNFGWANYYLQNLNGTWATSKNCYNVFYKQMIDDYNSPEARLMRCKMYLKSSDIRDLKLSDTILVNNVAYHINKIKQWRSEYEPTEVELIKIIQSTSKPNQPILKNNPPKMEIVTLNTLKELIESQNKAISQISKQVENLDGTIKKMDEQLIKLDERVKKLEEGEKPVGDDGSGEKPESDEKENSDYD